VRDDAGRKDQACSLRRLVDRSQQTPAGKLGTASIGIYSDLAHSKEVDYETAIACAEPSETMTTAADSGKNSIGRGDPYRVLHVVDVCTTGDESRPFGDHAVPNGARILVKRMLRPQ
jgi:hypothetical protein